MNGNSSERATPLIISAMRMACSSLSMTQGPAMRNRLPLPMRTSPTWNSVFRLQFSALRSQLRALDRRVTPNPPGMEGGAKPFFSVFLGDLGGELSSSYFFRPMEHLDGCRFLFGLSLLAVFIGRANKCPK